MDISQSVGNTALWYESDGLYSFKLFKHSESVHFYNPYFDLFCYEDEATIAQEWDKECKFRHGCLWQRAWVSDCGCLPGFWLLAQQISINDSGDFVWGHVQLFVPTIRRYLAVGCPAIATMVLTHSLHWNDQLLKCSLGYARCDQLETVPGRILDTLALQNVFGAFPPQGNKEGKHQKAAKDCSPVLWLGCFSHEIPAVITSRVRARQRLPRSYCWPSVLQKGSGFCC